MDDRRVADYFVVAGLSEDSQPFEFTNEAAIKTTYKQDPITDITVINKSAGEKPPRGYTCLDKTPTDYPANLNHGSLRTDEMYIYYRRGRDKPPLTDVGVLYEGKERLIKGCEVVHTTFFGSPANVNNSNNSRIYITYRRASENASSDQLAVVDLCIILENKGESPPHSYNQVMKNLNKGLVGSDVFLCYKKAMTKTDVLAYAPAILDRYPEEDYEDFPLPKSVPMFCLPMGATVETWSAKAQHPLPVFSTFVLTGLHSTKVFGAAVTFYEEYPEEKLTDLQMRHLGLKNKHIREQYRIMKTVHYNKSICLLSHWPFFDAFRKLLSYLYRISITGPHTVPLERHISHFMYDVPYPSPQRPRILVQLSHDSLSLSMPEDSPLPQSGASFITLLKNLGPEHCMTILLYVLHEHKILIHSLRPAVLTSVAEAVATLIFPLQWQCPYIPLCPLGLSDVLNAPTPYIIGLDSRYFDLFDPPPDVICIDLDTIRIWPPEDKKNLSYKMLPKKPTKILQETLHNLYDEVSKARASHVQDEISLEMAPIDFDFKRKHRETMLELDIQEAFLRFMACLMKGYKHYLKEVVGPSHTDRKPEFESTNIQSLFDMQGFLKSRDKSNHKFFTQMMRTQTFNRFIEERSFVSDKDASLAFFDECIEKVSETSDKPNLIERDDSHNSERTMFILPPEPTGLPEGVTYSYNGFPDLKHELFAQPQKKATLAVPGKQQTCPSSPVARRTKQEVKMSQKLAQQCITNPMTWAKCLLGHTYSLWFMILPAYIKHNQLVLKSLNTAYDVLKNMQRAKLKLPDELCYRILLQLCGQYNQPVLAVKVYSEMKRAGVQPNAITYGYYNKAVLEGKWPTTISRGSLLWRKVRNVIIGVAKFRKAIRRRSVSTYSNSGSEYDQISQASVDSFLEDHKSDLKHESIMKHDSVTDGKHSNGHIGKGIMEIPEELASTGGTSDRGYSSMTQEEAKHFSEYVSSGENKDSQAESKLKRDMKNVLRFSFGRQNKKKVTDLKEESVDGDDSAFHAHTTDIGTFEKLGSHLRSIVRKSRSSLSSTDSHETLKGSMIGSTSAGLLMVSDSIDNCMLTQSLGPGAGLSGSSESKQRKRHKSAGDHLQTKFRSNSLFANFRIRHQSDEDKLGMKFSDLIKKEHNADSTLFDSGESGENKNTVSEMQDISEEIKDSGVALDDNEINCSCEENGDSDEIESQTPVQSKEIVSGSLMDTSDIKGLTGGETKIDSVSESSDTVVEIRKNEMGRNIRGFKSYSSPIHSMSTPVTENDPLGLFVEPVTEKAEKRFAKMESPRTSPQKNREAFVASKPFANFDLGENLVADGGQGQCNTENSSGNKELNKESYSVSAVNSPIDKVQKGLFKIERTFSFPEELGHGGKGPAFKTNRSASEQTDQGALIHSSTSLNDSVKSDSKAEFRLFRTGSFRRHKDNFSGMLKFATGAVANKLSEIKLSMTPMKIGSRDSLTPSIDEVDSGNGEEDHYKESQKKFGSADYLKRSNDTLDSAGRTNGALSLPESAPNRSYMSEYVGRGRDEDSGSAHIKFSDIQTVLGEIAVVAEISSCCRCSRCRCLLYDEEVMAGWNADDSNLNTSCPFCNAKLVPHLLIYLKDHRGKRKSKLVDGDTDSIDLNGDGTHIHGDISYGKDAKLCSPHSKDLQLLFGEDMDPDNTSVKSFDSAHDPHDPWTQRLPHTPKHETTDKSPKMERRTSDNVSLSDMALAGRHRRTASECLTSTTDIPYSSSVESFDNSTFRGLRSPLNISLEERDLLPKHASLRSETNNGILERGMCSMEPISVPYLSPIVLRKNLETIIESEGNNSLADDKFVDEHPIIYWNLVYYFRRIETPSHLPGFLLSAKSLNKDYDEADKQKDKCSEVVIKPMWDNVKIHEEVGLPMHMAWNKGQSSTTVDALVTESHSFNRAVMHQIITNIQCNDVLSPIKLVMNGRRRCKPRKSRFRSMYREILFLSFSSCGRENIDHDAFDREYKLAFTRLSAGELKRLQRDDKPRPERVMWCRKVFGELEV